MSSIDDEPLYMEKWWGMTSLDTIVGRLAPAGLIPDRRGQAALNRAVRPIRAHAGTCRLPWAVMGRFFCIATIAERTATQPVRPRTSWGQSA